MIIFTRADESRRGITHADAETSGAWRHDQSVITLFRIFRPGGMWSHRVWSQHYNGQDQNEEKVREDLTLNANNLLQKMNSYVA